MTSDPLLRARSALEGINRARKGPKRSQGPSLRAQRQRWRQPQHGYTSQQHPH